ncbi:hypothetical protein BCR44DRAFT_60871 [Catenaria anguillulae PL171]|uniref:Uncharacterized protein n=1 Tax=Catenaria anguillulae PL171 TaxID=765915 RepID=A0A1Y2H806_9FUNG|nr:hypothetical protein BCR44DRAFT_60871 [Catenaria anguillulae PL171]
MATAYHPPRAQHSMLTLDPDHADADPAHLSAIPVSGSAAIRNHTRAIVTCLGHSTLAHSSSPLATLIYHLPHTREPGFWLHPRMLNAPFDAAHAVQPVHVAALCGSWPWFAWLVSLPPGKDLDGAEDGLEEQEDATPNEPMSTRSAGHVQMQGPNIVRVPALTDLRAIDDKGWNLMHYAVLGDAVEYARWIKEGGTWDTYLPRFTALVFMHHEQVARALCSEREGTAGLSPLDVAVAVGAEQSVLYLLERGLVPRVQVDLAGRTPLHHVRHASMLMLLLAVHPVKVRRWMQVHDLAGMPAWVYALRLAAPSQVLDMMVSYLDVVYEDGGMWLPGSDHKQVRDVARASIAARMHKAELSEREAKLILSWTNREAVGIGKEDEWALAKDDDEQGDVQGTMYDSAAELPPPPPYEPPPRPPTDTPRPASSASSRSAASTTSDNPADLYVKVNCSHAPCPFPRCKYSTTPLYCDQLSLHLEQDHSAPLAPIRHSRTKIQCSFPGSACGHARARQLVCVHLCPRLVFVYECDTARCAVSCAVVPFGKRVGQEQK